MHVCGPHVDTCSAVYPVGSVDYAGVQLMYLTWHIAEYSTLCATDLPNAFIICALTN